MEYLQLNTPEKVLDKTIDDKFGEIEKAGAEKQSELKKSYYKELRDQYLFSALNKNKNVKMELNRPC